MKRVLVPTDVAVAYLVREGVTEGQARSALQRWRAAGHINNYGGSKRGQARWDLAEISGQHGVYFHS